MTAAHAPSCETEENVYFSMIRSAEEIPGPFSKQRVHAGPPKHRHDIVVSAQRCLQMGVFRGFQYQSGNVGKELWTCCRPCSRMGVWSCTYAGYQEEEPAAYSMSACACDSACASEHCCHPTAAEGVCQQRQRSLLSLFTSV